MTKMLKLSAMIFKITVIKMVWKIYDKIEIFTRELESIEKKTMKILELKKYIVIKIKN